MSVLPLGLARVSNLLQTSVTEQSLESTQAQLLNVENEISTGQSVNQPSDNPTAAATIMQLNQSLATQQTYNDNINSASSQLSEAGSNLGSLTNLLEQASSIASADVNSDVTQSQRTSDAQVVQSLYNQALSIANTYYNGSYLFGGTEAQQQPFVESNGVVQFVGSSQTLQNTFNSALSEAFQVDGAAVFGSLTSSVAGATDLTPALTADTRLSDLNGATSTGVNLGSIQITDGTNTATVNLAGASSAGDVVNLINAAFPGGQITASLSGEGFNITSTASGANLQITDAGSDQTAEDLGISTPAGGAGATLTGASVGPKVTDLTTLASLRDGAGLDNSGLTITNGNVTRTITWPAGGTVQDMLNAINGAGLGVSATINADGTGIDIANASQGTTMSIGENGGSTASELGVQTMAASTLLSQLNNGSGVSVAGGSTADFQISDAAGGTFQVSLGSATTVQDVLNSINTATGGAVTASLAGTGSGIVLTDNTTGSGTLAVTALNGSSAATDLGITGPASGGTITGTDVGAPTSAGIFGNLQKLMNALQSGDQAGITAAGAALQTDTNRVIEYQGETGAAQKELVNQQTSLTSEKTATQTLLSTLQDTNMTTAITQLQTLQTALQAGYLETEDTEGLSLINFIS